MPTVEITSTPIKLLEHDPRRKFVSFMVESSQNKVYISDKGKPTKETAKWMLLDSQHLIISRETGHPERAFYAVSAGGNVDMCIGFQNDDTPKR